MLRIFRGERPAAAGAQAANAQAKDETTSASSDVSRPIGASAAGDAPHEHASRPGEAAGSTAATSTAQGSTAAASTAAASTAQSSTSESSAQKPRTGGEPGFLARGNIRRRARFLRAARELAYRDLGGLVFDLHRFGQRNDEVVQAKLATLSRIDAELRSLEEALKRRTPLTVLRQAGVSACPRCAAIHGSFDRFCPACGLPVRADARPIAPAPPAPPSTRPAASAAATPARAAVPQPTEAFLLPDPAPPPPGREQAASTSREPAPPDSRSEPPPRTPEAEPPPAAPPSGSAADAAANESGSEDGETEVIGPGRKGPRR